MTQRLLDCGVLGNTTLSIANPSLQKRLTTELTVGGNGQEISKKGCGQSLTLKKSILTDCGLPCWAHGIFYGYGGRVQKIWYLKITKVHIFKSI